ncbi:MAG: phospholipase [Cyanothece sp. SIO1E1]|nr:phospholipase [Cyanothece sp. SIO1E1]
MSLFRTNAQNPFKGPHQGQNLYQAGADPENAKAAMIMIHGRGATPQSLLPLGSEIEKNSEITLFAPQAQGFTWYPFSFLAPPEQNQPGLNSGLQAISDAIAKAEELGFSKDKIFLLGFSQGACLASEFVARHTQKYAGLFVLSGGMIGNQLHPDLYSGDLERTPVFLGCSDVDFHVPVERVHDSAEILESLNAEVTKVIYPNMGHTVNEDEIGHINRIVNAQL